METWNNLLWCLIINKSEGRFLQPLLVPWNKEVTIQRVLVFSHLIGNSLQWSNPVRLNNTWVIQKYMQRHDAQYHSGKTQLFTLRMKEGSLLWWEDKRHWSWSAGHRGHLGDTGGARGEVETWHNTRIGGCCHMCCTWPHCCCNRPDEIQKGGESQ